MSGYQSSGVPPLQNGSTAINTAILLAADAVILANAIANEFGFSSWGVFLDGLPAFAPEPDSVFSVDFKNDWRVADYQVEGGGFETYNKVRAPYDVRVTLTKSGIFVQAFLQSVAAAAASMNLYTVATKSGFYPSATIAHFDYRRTAVNGADLVTVDLWMQEVRVTATTQYSNTAAPSGADPENAGNVQPAEPTGAEAAAAGNFT